MKRVRLIDVAKKAEVAPSTVSMILNRRPHSWASKATAERVFNVANEMGYRPSKAAVGLRLGRFFTIGLVIPDLGNPYFCQMADMIDSKLEELGYDTIILGSRLNQDRERHCIGSIFERQIDGALLALINPDNIRSALGESNQGHTRPLVLFSGKGHGATNLNTVTIDYNPGLKEAIEHLHGLGHRRFAFLSARSLNQPADQRIEGYRNFLTERGVDKNASEVIRCGPTMESAKDALSEYFECTPPEKRCTAILALNDLSAIGVIRAAKEFGLDVPEDLSVVGTDDIPLASYLPKGLTTVTCDLEKVIDLGIASLMRQIESTRPESVSTNDPATETYITTHLVIRETTSPVKT